MSLIEDLQLEIKRNRELLSVAKGFNWTHIQWDIEEAEQALRGKDVMAILRAYKKLKRNDLMTEQERVCAKCGGAGFRVIGRGFNQYRGNRPVMQEIFECLKCGEIYSESDLDDLMVRK